MQRFHVKIYMPDSVKSQLKSFTNTLNNMTWQYSQHTLENIKHRCYNIKDILSFIKDLKLDYKDVFEVYTDNNNILKLCYRVSYNNIDLILVISKDKRLITIYINAKDDKHYTLNKNLYIQG